MATKKFLDYDGLQVYDENIKAYVDGAIDAIPSDVFEVIVTRTVADDGTETFSADKTSEEITEAYNNGKHCIVKYIPVSGRQEFYPLNSIANYTIKFSSSSGTTINDIVFNSYFGTITKTTRTVLMKNESYDSLTTTDKTIVGAINELDSTKADSDHNHDYVYYTEVEVDEKLSEKQDKNFVVTVTGNETNGYTVDKTFAEIKQAINNGLYTYVKLNGVTYDLLKLANSNVQFTSYTPSSMLYCKITIKSDNTVTYTANNVVAQEYIHGGVRASAKSSTDTVEAKIGTDGKLYVPTYPSLDEYYTETEVDEKIVSVTNQLSAKADSSHTHDGRYYTIEQIDGFEFISIADIDEICGGVTEGGLPSSDIDELMAQLEEV